MRLLRHTLIPSLCLGLVLLPACGERTDAPPTKENKEATRPAPPPIGEQERTANGSSGKSTPPPMGSTTTPAAATATTATVSLPADEATLRSAAAEAYVAGYPILETCRMAQALAKTKGFQHQRRPLRGADTVLRTPENDGPLSVALVDVGSEPVVLNLPAPTATVRLLVQVNDLSGRAVAVHRLLGDSDKTTVLVLAASDTKADLAGFARVISVPTRCALISIRWISAAADDKPVLKEAQSACRLRGLAEYKGWASLMTRSAVAWPSFDSAAVGDPRAFPVLNTLLSLFPAKAEQPLREQLARLGLKEGKSWDVTTLDASTRAALQAGISEGRNRITAACVGDKGDASTNGWIIPALPTDGDLPARAAAVARGLGSADASACVDAFIECDRDGQPLQGSRKYVLRFAAGQLPPADGGWSLSAQDALTGLPGDDAKRRLSLSTRSTGIQYVADESLTIYIQNATPGGEREANWLPCPEGRFRLCLHMPLPRAELKDGSYRLPGLVALEAPPMTPTEPPPMTQRETAPMTPMEPPPMAR